MTTSPPPLHWRAYAAEFAGTFILIIAGLSVVIFDFAPGSPVVAWVPDPFLRRLLTGFLFGSVGALLAISPAGRTSGAHLDPVLSWAFWFVGSLGALDALFYTLAQAAGAVAASLALAPIWGSFGKAVQYGATVPAAATSVWLPIAGEAVATFALVGGILWFVGHPRLRAYTPLLIPPLIALLVAFEAPLSGTSMNPARSLGPAIPSHTLGDLWIYVVGPVLGALLAATLVARADRVHVAKLAHHGHDPLGRFHGAAASSIAAALRRRLRAAFGAAK